MGIYEDNTKKRFAFLKALYEKTGGSRSAEEDMWKIGAELGLDSEDTTNVVEYLDGEGLLEEGGSLGGGITLSHAGVKEIEQTLRDPQKPTEHFPAGMNIIIEKMINSQIVQGSPGAQQHGTWSGDDTATALKWFRAVRDALPNLPLAPDVRAEADAEIATAEQQSKSPKPKKSIFVEVARSLRAILEGLTGSIAATKLLEAMPTILSVLR
jgi:hypothetical protein